MRAGDLRHRIELQEHAAGRDALGQPSTEWTSVATVWAALAPLAGRELLAAQAVSAEVTHLVTIRYQAQFASPRRMAAMRFLYAGRIFNIHASIDPEERHHMLELSCSEGLNNG